MVMLWVIICLIGSVFRFDVRIIFVCFSGVIEFNFCFSLKCVVVLIVVI